MGLQAIEAQNNETSQAAQRNRRIRSSSSSQLVRVLNSDVGLGEYLGTEWREEDRFMGKAVGTTAPPLPLAGQTKGIGGDDGTRTRGLCRDRAAF